MRISRSNLRLDFSSTSSTSSWRWPSWCLFCKWVLSSLTWLHSPSFSSRRLQKKATTTSRGAPADFDFRFHSKKTPLEILSLSSAICVPLRFVRDKELNEQQYERLTSSGEQLFCFGVRTPERQRVLFFLSLFRSVSIYLRVPTGFEPISACNIRVGHLVKVEANQRVPADLLFIRTTEKAGSCFIRTDQLDGETDWKIRSGVFRRSSPYALSLSLLKSKNFVFPRAFAEFSGGPFTTRSNCRLSRVYRHSTHRCTQSLRAKTSTNSSANSSVSLLPNLPAKTV